MRGLEQKYGAQVRLEPPRVAVEPGARQVAGPPDAGVTIVAFLDYECPGCAEAARILRRIRERFPEDVRLAVRAYPLSMHPNAARAADAAACAGEQGRFWEMHERLFAHQDKLQPDDLKGYSRDLGLDAARFDACFAGAARAPSWMKDKDDGERAGVKATPTIFVNGRLVPSGSYMAISGLVRDELQRRSASSR